MSLASLLEQMRQEENPKAAVELPFAWAASSPHVWDANAALLDLWLAEFGRLVTRERRKDKAVPGGEIDRPKLLREPRAAALEELREFNRHPAALLWPHVNRQQIAFELALLLRRPRLLSPLQSGWSAPCCLLIHYAKSDPLGFARMAMDLAGTGEANWREEAMRVPPGIRATVGTDQPNSCLALLVAAVTGRPPEQLTGAATPAEFAGWMRRLGYREIELSDGPAALGQEFPGVVLLKLAAPLLQGVTGSPVEEPHWALLRRVRTSADGVFVKFLTCGGAWETTLQQTLLEECILARIAAI